jgi:hypothetical protein
MKFKSKGKVFVAHHFFVESYRRVNDKYLISNIVKTQTYQTTIHWRNALSKKQFDINKRIEYFDNYFS